MWVTRWGSKGLENGKDVFRITWVREILVHGFCWVEGNRFFW